MPRFQHTAARRRLDRASALSVLVRLFQHTAARRRLGICPPSSVSGCPLFQHTAARRRLARWSGCGRCMVKVSTHSRPKAAGTKKKATLSIRRFQHTAARRRLGPPELRRASSSRFQHTAARRRLGCLCWSAEFWATFQHTAARRRLDADIRTNAIRIMFQHTAARRRLVLLFGFGQVGFVVSTHSRPKAAGCRQS